MRTAGEKRTYRIAAIVAPVTFSGGVARLTAGRFQRATTRITPKKDKMFNTNAAPIPANAITKPARPMDRSEVVDQVLWALQDEGGTTAKYLAEHESPPSPKHWLPENRSRRWKDWATMSRSRVRGGLSGLGPVRNYAEISER